MVSPLTAYMSAAKLTTVRALADALELERSFVSRLLSGERKPGRDTAFHIESKTRGAVPASAWTEKRRASKRRVLARRP